VRSAGRGSLWWGYIPVIALDVWEYSDFTVGPVSIQGPKGSTGVASTEFAAAVTVDTAFTAASAVVGAGVSAFAGPVAGVGAGFLTGLWLSGSFREGGIELVDSFYESLITTPNPSHWGTKDFTHKSFR